MLSCTGSKMSLSMRDADQTSGADLNPSMRLPGQATNQLQPLSNPTRDEGAGEKRRRAQQDEDEAAIPSPHPNPNPSP